MEELWPNNKRGRTQGFLQCKWGQTRTWCWISCSQGHHVHCHGMSPNFQQAHHHPPEGSPFQHRNSISVCPNVRLWWQRRRILWPATQCHWSDIEDILVVQGHWNVKVSKDACGNWQGICSPFCNNNKKWERIRLLEFATFNDLELANTFGHYKAPRRWTWHSPKGQHHSQHDYVLVSEHCQNTKFSRSRHLKWPRHADNDLPPSPEKNQQAKTHKTQTFDLEKLKDPNVLEIFQAMRSLYLSPSWTIKRETCIQWSPPSTQQWLNQPVVSLANIVRRKKKQKKTGSL